MSDGYTHAPSGDLSGRSRGAVIRIFGVILIILGWLDIMLSWRGGFEIVTFHAVLMASGLGLYAIGAIRRRDHLDIDRRAAAESRNAGRTTSQTWPPTKTE